MFRPTLIVGSYLVLKRVFQEPGRRPGVLPTGGGGQGGGLACLEASTHRTPPLQVLTNFHPTTHKPRQT